MAYFDGFDEDDEQQADIENRRKFLAALVSAPKQQVLGRRAPDDSSPSASPAPGGTGGFFGPLGSPRVPTTRALPQPNPPDFGDKPFPRMTPTPPGFSVPPIALGRPARPDVMPTREDFPAKPELSGWKKYLGLGLATLAGSPQLAEGILHGQRDKAERQYQQANKSWEQEQADKYRAAQTRNLNAEAAAKENKPDATDKKIDEYTNDQQQRVQVMQRADGSTYERVGGKVYERPPEGNFEEQAYQEARKTNPGLTRLDFAKRYAGATQKPEQPQRPQQALGVTPDGQVIEIKPGMKLPPGTKPLGGEMTATLKGEQGEEAGLSANQYAKDYMAKGVFTGAGDEALMEKYFELAKPSSGFRMTQAQIEMLQKARDLMGSISAKAKHLLTPEAPYFSDTQRKQIVDTMGDLQRAREEVKPGAARATGKTFTQQDVDDAARQYGIAPAQIEQSFISKGYVKKP